MIVNMNVGLNGVPLTVTAPAGATVTISKDGKSQTKVAGSDGIAVFNGLDGGEWTVTITDGVQTATKKVTIATDYSTVISFSAIPEFTYTGDYEIVSDDDEPITASQDNWKIRFLTSGTLTFTALNGAENGIDVFCVGGGAGGGLGPVGGAGGGSGGGGGYTTTERAKVVSENVAYDIVIGAGGIGNINSNQVNTSGSGGSTSAFDVVAAGGEGISAAYCGSNGGSGGGSAYCNGGSDGTGGESYSTNMKSGSGQGTTTREFGESNGKLYAGGGGGGANYNGSPAAGSGGAGGGADGTYKANGISAEANTGGGGGGTGREYNAGNGGSGIVIIRNAREVA